MGEVSKIFTLIKLHNFFPNCTCNHSYKLKLKTSWFYCGFCKHSSSFNAHPSKILTLELAKFECISKKYTFSLKLAQSILIAKTNFSIAIANCLLNLPFSDFVDVLVKRNRKKLKFIPSWVEYGTFFYNSRTCKWTSTKSKKSKSSFEHVSGDTFKDSSLSVVMAMMKMLMTHLSSLDIVHTL